MSKFGGLGGRNETYNWADIGKEATTKAVTNTMYGINGVGEVAFQERISELTNKLKKSEENRAKQEIAHNKKVKALKEEIKELEDRHMHSFMDTIPLHQDDEEDERWIKF